MLQVQSLLSCHSPAGQLRMLLVQPVNMLLLLQEMIWLGTCMARTVMSQQSSGLKLYRRH